MRSILLQSSAEEWIMELFTNISDDVDDRLDLLHGVVVEETQPGDALLEAHFVID